MLPAKKIPPVEVVQPTIVRDVLIVACALLAVAALALLGKIAELQQRTSVQGRALLAAAERCMASELPSHVFMIQADTPADAIKTLRGAELASMQFRQQFILSAEGK